MSQSWRYTRRSLSAGTTVFSAAVTLDGMLDGVNIDDMSARAIYLDDGLQTITAIKVRTWQEKVMFNFPSYM